MRDQLLGYLLNALEPAEERLVQARLAEDAELRSDLARLRTSLEPLAADDQPFEPPLGLADRACDRVARARMPLTPAFSAQTNSWRVQDLVVAAGILIAAGWLLFPAIYQSRFEARRVACQNNLRLLNVALHQYSNLSGGFFPLVPADGPMAAAGSYGPLLVDWGFVEDDSWLVCPASAFAAERPDYRVPRTAQIMAASAEELPKLRAIMGGTYGYGFGYVQGGRYRAHRDLGRSSFPIMADAPERAMDGGSPNHGNCGQNVSFECGRVQFLNCCRIAERDDHIFENWYGRVGAGVGPEDAVIGRSSDMSDVGAAD